MKKKILYWGPFTDKGIGTKKAILNSACSINKYSDEFEAIIIDAIGEWAEESPKKKIKFLKLGPNIFSKLPKYGLLKSRIAFMQIFFVSFFKLKNLIKSIKPEYLMIHLISSLPLILFIIFNFKTKLLFRVSGKPNLNFFRSLLWKLSDKNIQNVFCNTHEQKKELIEKKIFSPNKIEVLYDPVFNLSDISNERNDNKFHDRFLKGNILLVGRLTKQKNFKLIINAFNELKEAELKNYKIFIIGEGEENHKLQQIIYNLKLENSIFLLGSNKNVTKYYFNSKIFILTSLWEDPGFVLIEAAINNCFIISSDCRSGPNEILEYGKGGLLFKNNNISSLKQKIKEYISLNDKDLLQMKINAKKM